MGSFLSSFRIIRVLAGLGPRWAMSSYASRRAVRRAGGCEAHTSADGMERLSILAQIMSDQSNYSMKIAFGRTSIAPEVIPCSPVGLLTSENAFWLDR